MTQAQIAERLVKKVAGGEGLTAEEASSLVVAYRMQVHHTAGRDEEIRRLRRANLKLRHEARRQGHGSPIGRRPSQGGGR